jgi:GMP synthase-like glutamine amidotransferase
MPPKKFAVIDCEDDARWTGLASCIVALFGRDDETWHHYRAYDGEFPSDEDFATYEGILVSGSSHRADGEGLRWAEATREWCARALDSRREDYLNAEGKVKVLAMGFGAYACCLACGGKVGMLQNSSHVVGQTALTPTREWRDGESFVNAAKTYGPTLDGTGERMVVHQNRSQRFERLPEDAVVVATAAGDDNEAEIWSNREGTLLAWQCSFSDGVASVLSHKVESGLDAVKSTTARVKRDIGKARDDLPNNDAGFLIGVGRCFIRGGEAPPGEDEAYLRARRHKARETLTWASKRREDIMTARAQNRTSAGAKTSGSKDPSDAAAPDRGAAAARAFTRVADAVNAEFAVATNEVRFLANANAVAMRDYDQIGQQIADLHVFVGSLKSKGESIRPKLEAVSRIETEVGVLERVFAKLDQHVTALEDRFKSLQTKAAQL